MYNIANHRTVRQEWIMHLIQQLYRLLLHIFREYCCSWKCANHRWIRMKSYNDLPAARSLQKQIAHKQSGSYHKVLCWWLWFSSAGCIGLFPVHTHCCRWSSPSRRRGLPMMGKQSSCRCRMPEMGQYCSSHTLHRIRRAFHGTLEHRKVKVGTMVVISSHNT